MNFHRVRTYVNSMEIISFAITASDLSWKLFFAEEKESGVFLGTMSIVFHCLPSASTSRVQTTADFFRVSNVLKICLVTMQPKRQRSLYR